MAYIREVELVDPITGSPLQITDDGKIQIESIGSITGNISLPDGAATDAKIDTVISNQTNSTQKTKLTDGTNTVNLKEDSDGEFHLSTSMIQDVKVDSNNSSTTNLTSANSYTFTGTGTTTLGVVGLQWNLATDQNCTVYIEQSDDNTNWDISDVFNYKITAKTGIDGNTVQALSAYWRIRVVLVKETATTFFRLSGVLCPIANPLPRALSKEGNLKVAAMPGYPGGHNAVTSIAQTININSPGTYNAIYGVPNTIVEGSFAGIDTLEVGSTSEMYMQMFRLSANNIVKIIGSLSSATTDVEIDDFDSNVTTNWIETSDLTVAQESSIVHEGTGSMRVLVSRKGANRTVTRTWTSDQDYTDTDTIDWWYRSTTNNITWRIILEDSSGNQTQSDIFGSSSINTWAEVRKELINFEEQQVASTDLSAIRKIIFYCVTDNNTNNYTYFDILKKEETKEITTKVELYDFGTNATPTNLSDGTIITMDNGDTDVSGTAYEPLRKLFEVPFVVGLDPTNELTPGNYYGIVITLTNVVAYKNGTKVYQNGDMYAINSGTGALTSQNDTMYFGVYCAPETFAIKHFHFRSDSLDNKDTELYVTMINSDSVCSDAYALHLKFLANSEITFHVDDIITHTKEEKFRVLIDHDILSSMTKCQVNVEFTYDDFVRYG